MGRLRLAADPNYLWESPIKEDSLMEIVHIVNEIGELIPRFVFKEYKKMYLFLTDDPQQHGSRLQLGFLFFVDTDKIVGDDKDERRKVIISLIKDGLIEMGKTHGWSKEHIDELFVKVK
ncbi:hypothetical protein [Eikenella corrodens]|uniref:Uncharacterized protein n=1 Tax=Eikenella corrodens TaxID=539 RepID=A0A3S9SJK1_EIKCO|nr:hypothetical protein [Eikenella corrodens]AZR59649.1 hypothetical protein ELB75_06210 [Eikenella corrodens]